MSRMGVGVRSAALAVVMAAALATLGGCASAADEPVGDLVESWSQADSDGWADEVMPIETVLLTSDDELEQWLDDHAGSEAGEAVAEVLRAVDLTEHVLVIGGYSRCMEYSVVLLENDGALRFAVTRDKEDEQTDCAWSPYTIDAWAVPRSDAGDDPRLAEGPSDTES